MRPWGGVDVLRWRSGGTVLAAVAALALAGCGKPAGIDGDLTNNWSAMPEAKLAEPVDRACYDVWPEDPTTVTKWPAPVACTAVHTVETVHLGRFTGDDATHDTPPPEGGPGRRKAYEDCGASATAFLGGDWRGGRLDLLLTTPIAKHWDAGARWYRCDLLAFDPDAGKALRQPGSLQGALTGARPLALGCFNVVGRGDDVDSMPTVDCASPHDAEFAGVYDAPDGPWPSDDKQRTDAQTAGCYGVIAKFAGVPNDGNLRARTGFVLTPFDKAAWELGNRGTRCFLMPGEKHSKSLRGAGPSGLPIHYR